ncbi:MAG TPA: TetR/AcrR family transcriptional regulator [Opitutaceae bacterium]
MPVPKKKPPRSPSPEDRARILDAARRAFLAHGFAGTTMDDLASELGMSKKTLYLSFSGKEAIAEALVATKVASIISGIDSIMADPDAGFSARARRVLDHVMTELSSVSPVFLRDLQRSMPHIYRRIENVRRNVVPELWGRLILEGQAEGLVRDDVDPAFAAELMLHAVQGILHPDTLDRLHLTPRQAFAKTTNLLLGGMLTAAGRRDHEKSERSI